MDLEKLLKFSYSFIPTMISNVIYIANMQGTTSKHKTFQAKRQCQPKTLLRSQTPSRS